MKPQDVHVLYVSGEELDWGIIQAIISPYASYQLGPHCWLIRAPQDIEFFYKLRAMLPPAPSKSELLYFPVSDAQIRLVAQGGWGLGLWLDRESESQSPNPHPP